jgi:ABC-type glycerol-3-phosphate transport system permease component
VEVAVELQPPVLVGGGAQLRLDRAQPLDGLVGEVGGLAAGLAISMLPMLILYLCLSDHFMRGMTAGAVKG